MLWSLPTWKNLLTHSSHFVLVSYLKVLANLLSSVLLAPVRCARVSGKVFRKKCLPLATLVGGNNEIEDSAKLNHSPNVVQHIENEMKKTLSILVLLIFGISLNAQNEKPEREAFKLIVAIDSVNFYQQDVAKSPYFVKDKILQIYPSEKIFIETEIKSDSIYSMSVVKENLNPERTIIVEFNQNVQGRIHDGMMLSVKNPFDKTLKYEALKSKLIKEKDYDKIVDPKKMIYPR